MRGLVHIAQAAALALTVAKPFSPALAASERHAIVIGNETYSRAHPGRVNLPKAPADAQLYRKILGDLGWTISNQEWRDLTGEKMRDALKTGAFTGQDILLIFSGHGWSDKNDYYLLSSMLEGHEYIGQESTIEQGSLSLSTIISKLNEKKPARIVIIIDACNDVPIIGGRSEARPKVTFQQFTGVELLILYSSGPGGLAYEDIEGLEDSEYSVFTRIFAPLIQDDIPLLEAFIKARLRVEELIRTRTSLAPDKYQIPHIVYDNIDGRFSLAAAAPVAENPPGTPPVEVNWQSDPEICRIAPDALAEALAARDAADWNEVREQLHVVNCIYYAALERLGIKELAFDVDSNGLVTLTETSGVSEFRAGEALDMIMVRHNGNRPLRIARPTIDEFRDMLALNGFLPGTKFASMLKDGRESRTVLDLEITQ